MPYVNLRGFSGTIKEVHLTPPTSFVRRVSSLGRSLDDFVDAFGYPDTFITSVHTGWLGAQTLSEFQLSVSHMVSQQEADLLWRWIEASNESGHMRTRRVGRVD
jgi:hypothetical protein